MRHVLKSALCAAALMAGAALQAVADDATCETEKLGAALESVQAVIKDGTTLAAYVPQMDSYVKACPNQAWINVLGGELDLIVFRGLRQANGGAPAQDSVNYLARAFERSNVFYAGPDETRNRRTNIATSYNFYNTLDYSIASDSRGAIIGELVTLALAGTVHPYLAATTPPECKGWLVSDAQTISYKISTAADTPLLAFVEAAAEACRNQPLRSSLSPSALLAKAYLRLIDTGQVTEPDEVKRMLLAAEDNAKAYLGDDEFVAFYFDKTDVNKLKSLLRKYGVHSGPGEAVIDRALWFTPEYIGSEAAIRSIVYSLDDYWTPLAAGDTEAPGEEVAKARNRMTAYLLELNKEGGAAGVQDQASAMLRDAVTAFHKREILSPEMQDRKDMPSWLYDVVIRILTPQPPVSSNSQ
ncbi:hypothetical protein ACQKH5_15035 [Hyphomonas sp. NPDC076900]|uniref:hypothetical protein n=1 Tax=unclassified Hyphomonas TaxID=2630699 RepID=UPI003D06CE91